MERVDDTLTVVWKRKSVDMERQVATFSDGVQITYGVTTVHADRLVLHMAEEERFGVADGNVRLIDPDGTIDARNLKFDWRQGTGEASGVLVRALDVVIMAESMSITPDRWELIKAVGMPCEGSPAPIKLASPRVVIYPGRRARIEKPRISIYGVNLPTLPTASMTLDRRVVGLTTPSITEKRGQGLGVSWKSGFLLDDSTGLTASFLSFPRSFPSYSLEVARSSVPPTASTGLISPASDMEERFRFGYFENISVPEPDSELRRRNSPRHTVSIGSYWGIEPVARSTSPTFNKPLEVSLERGTSLGDFKGVIQLRAQQVQETFGKKVERGSVSLSVGPPRIEVARNLSGLVRFDAYTASSVGQTFGWGQAQVGLVATPVKGLRIGAAYHDSLEVGTPHFASDSLFSPRGWIFRTDVLAGPRKFSYLAKWDSSSNQWIDREYQASQVMDCFEAYILFRENPSEYRFGIRMRIDRFLNALQRREVKR